MSSKIGIAKQSKRGKRREARTQYVSIYNAPDPFPPRAYRTMTYAGSFFPLSATTQFNTGTENNFRLNSLFDPDATGGSHQPYGMDQMAALYNRYLVHKVDIDLFIQNTPGNQSGAVVMITRPSANNFALNGNSVSDIMEKSMGHAVFPRPTGDSLHYRVSWNIWDVEGTTKQQITANTEEYSALCSLNPARMPTFAIAVANTASTSAINFAVIVKMTYHAEFYDRITLTASN